MLRCLCLILVVCWPGLAQRVITTVAGTDTIPIAGGIPATQASIGVNCVTTDRAGNFYICDEFQNVVLKVTDGRIFVIAGNGIQTFSGDGGLALNASLNEPQGVAVDSAGNIYLADSFNHRIRKIDTSGVITTVAGNGQPGFSGDGGPATQARLNRPYRIEFDSTNNLYMVDSLNNRIRKVDRQGDITTVAGTGQVGFSGDGGPATQATLGNPVSITFDADDSLYIADRENNRIRRVDSRGVITTIAGTGQAGFSGDGGPARNATFYWPYSLDFDSAGNLYVLDYVNNRVRRIDRSGNITTVAGNGQRGFAGDGGPATAAPLEFPFAIAVDTSDRLLISDTFNNRIRRVAGGIITTVAGTGRLQELGDGGPATSAQFNRPHGVFVDRTGAMFVADTFHHRIRRIDPSGQIRTVAGNGRLGYSGDGGPATDATFNAPENVALDAAGNLYIADTFNHVIRRVTPLGVIERYAGNGFAWFSGDNGPAREASLNLPRGIALDADGNLYIADTENHRVRRVGTNGVIRTVAGTGEAGFSGDGGAATAARLRQPADLAVDAAGNVCVADTGNNRVRRITPAGIISTVAGNGNYAYSGDGGDATNASLAAPAGVGVDAEGILYIADTWNDRIRAVDRSGRITTIAGDGRRGVNGDGDLAVLASLGAPEGVWIDSSGDIYIADTRNRRIRRLLRVPPSFTLSRSALEFSAPSDGAVSTAQPVGVLASVVGVPFAAGVTTGGADWVRVTAAQGATPGRIQVSADPSGLPPGVYRPTLTVTAPNATPGRRDVALTFFVGPPEAAKLSVTPSSLAFSAAQGAGAQTRTLTVANLGGGQLDFLAAAAASSGDSPWLSVSADAGTARPGEPSTLVVTVDPSVLPPGTYSGAIAFASATTGESIEIPVTLGITAIQQKIVLSQTGLSFVAVAGGDAPPQTFGIANDGLGVMNWTVATQMLSGREWLSVSAASGSTDAAGAPPGVDVLVDAARLEPGQFTGLVKVEAPGADNSPQYISVFLEVLPPGSNPGPSLRPSGLRFTAAAGGPNPGSQIVLVYNPASTPVNFRSSRAFFEGRELEGKDWFVHVPSGATVTRGQPTRVVVQPSIAGLAPGVRRGAINLEFSDGSVRTISVLLVLAPAAAAPGPEISQGLVRSPYATGCSPSRLLPVITSLAQDFAVSAGWPVAVQARVLDDCGDPMTAGTVTATFSNGDPPLPLTSLRDGAWAATWQSRNARPGVTVTLRASIPGSRMEGSTSLTGALRASSGQPRIESGGIASAASLSSRMAPAPGAMVTIRGSELADTTERTELVPLPTAIGSTSVLLGGRSLPLASVAPDGITALVPFDLPVNSRQQLIVQRGASITVPESVTLGPAQPAIYTKDGSGSGQGRIYRVGEDGSEVLAEPGNAAAAGNVIVIHAAGLGPVDPPVEAGAAAPADPLSLVVQPVALTIGDVAAQVRSAELLPGSVGIYRIRAVMPEGVAAGDAVPVVLRAGGQASPPVTMAIQ